MKVALRGTVPLLAGLSFACYRAEGLDATRAAAVGAPVLAAEADALRSSGSAPPREIPEASWPPGIRRLEPEAVRVTAEGVFVQCRKRFVEEEGVFIAFTGVEVDTEPGRDPSFKPIAGRVYLYRIKG